MIGMWKGAIRDNLKISGEPKRTVVDNMCTRGVVKGLCLKFIDGGACRTYGHSSSVQQLEKK